MIFEIIFMSSLFPIPICRFPFLVLKIAVTTYMHTYIHTYIHTCMHACIHTYIHIYIHTLLQLPKRVFQLQGKGERRYKILLCKVCFLARKDKQRDREPSPFGPFLTTDRNDAYSYPFIYVSWWNLYSFVYLKPKNGSQCIKMLLITN